MNDIYNVTSFTTVTTYLNYTIVISLRLIEYVGCPKWCD